MTYPGQRHQIVIDLEAGNADLGPSHEDTNENENDADGKKSERFGIGTGIGHIGSERAGVVPDGSKEQLTKKTEDSNDLKKKKKGHTCPREWKGRHTYIHCTELVDAYVWMQE